MKREKRAEASREEHGFEEEAEEEEEEGWSTTRRAERSECPGEGEVKESRGGSLVRKGKKNREKKKKKKSERERSDHMNPGSLLLSTYMPSHQMAVCVHTPEMLQPNAPHSLQNHCYQQ